MDGARFIRTIRLENILSFGPAGEPFSLEPLNVFIGPNASGKSNLIEALSLLEATPDDIQEPIRDGGGIRDWLWKGTAKTPIATVEVTVDALRVKTLLRYRLSFTETGGRFELRDEVIEPAKASKGEGSFYQYREGKPVINRKVSTPSYRRSMRGIKPENLKLNQSILSQRRDGELYPELDRLALTFGTLGLYRGLDVSREAPVRLPQKADEYQGFLLEDAPNLSLVMSRLRNQPDVKKEMLERLRDFYPSVEDFVVETSGGLVQTFFHEKGLRHPIPATRLSDGTLRYLCLLAVLCDPEPLPIVCIEEPELGLHPDIIPEVAKLLVGASSRCQLFVTTHSDVLIDALSDTPEAVVVCEKVDGATQLRRLDAEQLKPWLEKYRLGELWTQGQIGGNRW